MTFHRVARQHHCSRIIPHCIRQQNADRRQRAGQRRNQHARNAQRPRQRARVQRPSSAECHERKVARIVAALHANHANRLLHLRFDHAQNPRRKSSTVPSAPFAPASSPRCARRRSCTPPPRKLSASRRPEHKVGIGHRRPLAAPKTNRVPDRRRPTPARRAACRPRQIAQETRHPRPRCECPASVRRSALPPL